MRGRGQAVLGMLVVGALTVAGAGCGGDDTPDTATQGPAATIGDDTAPPGTGAGGAKGKDGGGAASGEASDEGEGGRGGATSGTLGETVYFNGFTFELGDVSLAPGEDLDGNPDPSVQTLTVETRVTNPSRSAAMPRVEDFTLEQDGAVVQHDQYAPGLDGLGGIPEVPGGATSNGTIDFGGLPADFTLDGVVLVFGGTDTHQARAPLDGEGEAVTLAPVEFPASGTATAGHVSLTLTGGKVVFGDEYSHFAQPAEKDILMLTFDVTATSALGLHQNVMSENVRVVLPDGTSVAPRGGENNAPNEIIESGSTLQGLFARFDIPAGERGDFQVVFTGDYGDGAADVEGAAPFTIPAQ